MVLVLLGEGEQEGEEEGDGEVVWEQVAEQAEWAASEPVLARVGSASALNAGQLSRIRLRSLVLRLVARGAGQKW